MTKALTMSTRRAVKRRHRLNLITPAARAALLSPGFADLRKIIHDARALAGRIGAFRDTHPEMCGCELCQHERDGRHHNAPTTSEHLAAAQRDLQSLADGLLMDLPLAVALASVEGATS